MYGVASLVSNLLFRSSDGMICTSLLATCRIVIASPTQNMVTDMPSFEQLCVPKELELARHLQDDSCLIGKRIK